MFSIGVEEQEIVIRINSQLVDRDALSRLLDYVELESIRHRSQMTRTEASALAKEVDLKVWEKVRQNCVED